MPPGCPGLSGRRPRQANGNEKASRPGQGRKASFRGTTLLGRSRVIHVGGAAGSRTPYLNTASVALSRMSYSPTCVSPLNVRYRGRPGEQYCGFLIAAHERVRRSVPPHTIRRWFRRVYYSRSQPAVQQRSRCDDGEYQCARIKSNSSATFADSACNQDNNPEKRCPVDVTCLPHFEGANP